MAAITIDQDKLGSMLEFILMAHAAHEVTLLDAQEALAHVVTAAGLGNEADVRAWTNPEQLAQWKTGCINKHNPDQNASAQFNGKQEPAAGTGG